MRKYIFNIVNLFSLLSFFMLLPTEAQVHRNLYSNNENGYINWVKSYSHLNSINQLQNAIFSIPVTNANSKFDDILRMDSLITSSVQGGSFKVLFEYNFDGYITEQLILSDVGNSWFNSFLHYFYYDENGTLVQEIHLGWNTSHWDTLSQISYTYNLQGVIFQYVFQGYTKDNWVNVMRHTFEYDSSRNETVSLLEEWQGGNWHNKFLFNSYYSDLNLRDSLLVQIWDNTEWQNYSKTNLYYNIQNNFLESFIAKIWTGSSWLNYLSRKIVNDSNGNQIEQLEEIWNEGVWENSVRRFYSYIDLNYIENAFCELWFENNWVSGDDVILVEYPNGYTIGFITHILTVYYNVTGVNENTNYNPQNFRLEQNYPNPFNPSTMIRYEIPERSFVTLKVFDVLGNEIVTLVNEEKTAG
ncbi:MAG: hypothetical protein O6940_04615, partial [Ignavibacteria bacterium]|nr:hypothetical protein [Ignavibacteria bacterium]